MNKEIKSRIKHKRDTDTNWTNVNPILLDGEIVVVDNETGRPKLKVGDGESSYSQLSFINTSDTTQTINTETWTFTLVDGTTVSKQIVVE